MQIPKELPHAQKPTLLVVADTQTAKLYLMHDDQMDLINEIFFPEEWTSDKEAGFGQYGSRGEMQSFGNPDPVPGEEHVLKDHLIKSLNEDLFTRLQNKEFNEWYLVAPDYIMKTIKDSLHSYLAKALKKTLSANLINHNPLEVLKRLT